MTDVLEKLEATFGRPLTAAERSTVLAQLPTPRMRKGGKVGVAEMRSHVEELCRRYNLEVRSCARPYKAIALREFEEIHIPAVRSAISYATALHEIGHVVGPHQYSKRVLVRERGAWSWAKRNALKWTDAMDADMRRSLERYEEAIASGRCPFVTPTNVSRLS